MLLNDTQLEAVNHKEGPLMVLAGPGSGKTTVITHRALTLTEKGGIPARNVLVVTFSKAAATEMEQRYKAVKQGECCSFGTFHGIFFRVLKARYGYGIEQVLQEPERRDIINKLIAAVGFASDEDMQSAVRNEISLVKNELHDLRYYNSNIMGNDEFRQIFSQYEEIKTERAKIDFDDMLTGCYHLWKTEPDCLAMWQRRYPYIMIDEFQDINYVQYECMRMLSASPHHLCIVGDDDQSIYRFRGARPEFLLQFPKDYPKVKSVVLETNYRSTDPIISFSNVVISQNSVRYEKKIIGTHKSGPTPKILTLADQNHEANYVAAKIKKLSDFNEAAVIYRTNMQARAFVDAFTQANIPYIVKDEVSIIYEHWVAKDLFAYLRLCRGLGDRDDLERIINKPFRFISKAFISKARKENRDIFQWYAKSNMLNSGQMRRMEDLALDLALISKYKVSKAISHIRKKAGYDDYLKDYSNYRNISPVGLYEIVAELQEAAESFEKTEDFLSHAEEAVSGKNLKEPEGPRVTLTTMHSAKGLEFDTVYIAGAVEGLIPHQHSKTEVEMEEERRLFYVGATRAKKNLYISVIKKRHEQPVEPSRFIKNFKRGGAKWESFQEKYGNVKGLLRQ